MIKSTFSLVIVVLLGCALSVQTSPDDSAQDYSTSQLSSSSSAASSVTSQYSSSSRSSSSASSEQFSELNNNNDNYNQCEEEPETPSTTPEQPNTTEEPSTPPGNPSTTPTTDINNLEDDFDSGNGKFTADFFYNVVKTNPGKSVIMSPYSILLLLAQVLLGASGKSAQQILNVLNLRNDDEIKAVIPKILYEIAEQKNLTLKYAQRITGNAKYKFNEAFIEDAKIFNSEVVTIDFSNPEKAADNINKWVADNTNGKIKNLVPASAFTPYTQLVLTNAMYFMGEWKKKFEKDNTQPEDFYISETESVKVPMMNQLKFFNFGELDDLDAKAVELPYVNQNLTYLIILPNKRTGIENMLSKLINLKNVRSKMQSTKVNLSMPKFNTTTSIDLKNILPEIGISEIFKPDELRNMLVDADGKPLQTSVTDALHKAIIDVNETGSEAAAATAILVGATAARIEPEPKEFNANHPYAYYLLFRGTPLFCGLYAGN